MNHRAKVFVNGLYNIYDFSGFFSTLFFLLDFARILGWTAETGLKTGNYLAWVNSNLYGEHWYEVAFLFFSITWLGSLAIRWIEKTLTEAMEH